MWIQQQTKVRVFGAATILALMFICSLAAFAAPASSWVLTSTKSSLSFSGAAGSSPACQSLDVYDTTPAGPLPITMSTDASWLTVTPTTGSTEIVVSVCVKTAGLAAGTYKGHVITTQRATNSAGQGVNNSPYSVPVTLTITGSTQTKALTASSSALSFSAVTGGAAPATQSLTIGENPAGAVAYTATADQSWITLSAASGTTSSTIQVGAKNAGLAAGTYSGHVIVSASGVTNTPTSIPVTLVVTAAQTKALTASPSSLAFSGVVGGAAPATQSLTIGENPAAAVAYTATADQAWMTLSAASGTTSSAIQVGANISGLAAGTYSGHVIVSASGVTNSPMSIPVTLTVTAAQTKALTASPSSLAFSGVAGGAAPATQSLTIGENPAGAVAYTATADQAWMTLSAASGTTSSVIQVGAKTAGLAAGNYTGHVIVSASGVTNSPMSVTVTLAVTASQTSLLTASPTSEAFGNINVGNNNTKSVTITNSGTSSVTISSISAVGAGMSANGIATPMTLVAGQTTVLSVVFAPTASGAVNGTVSVISNATNSPAVITATGTGVQPQLSASPSTLNFGSMAVGSSGTQTITLTNAGGASATISQVVAAGTGYTMSGITLPAALAAGASTSFSVKFAPTVAGSDSGSVTVTSNTPNSPTMVALNGNGTAAVAHSVSLSWVASTSTVVGYNIYRGSVSGGPYTLLNSTPGAALSYTDSSVVAGQTYFYVVTAVTSTGMESVVSNEVSVLIPTP